MAVVEFPKVPSLHLVASVELPRATKLPSPAREHSNASGEEEYVPGSHTVQAGEDGLGAWLPGQHG